MKYESLIRGKSYWTEPIIKPVDSKTMRSFYRRKLLFNKMIIIWAIVRKKAYSIKNHEWYEKIAWCRLSRVN